MKKLILILLGLMILPLVSGAFPPITASTNQGLGFTCFNATQVVGTAATMNCTDNEGNVDLSTTSATHKGSSHFNITVNLAADIYICEISCSENNGLRWTQGLYVRTTPLVVADNIGINADDVDGDFTAADFETDFITAAKIAANAIGSSEIAANAIGVSEFNAEADVWQYGERNLTTFDEDETNIDIDGTTIGTASTCTALTTNNDKTGYTTSAFSGTASTSIGLISLESSLLPIGIDVNTSLDNQNTLSVSLEEVNVTTQSTVNDIDIRLNLSHSGGNWSNTASSGLTVVSITEGVSINLSADHGSGSWEDAGSAVNLSQTWETNLSNSCVINATIFPTKAGEMLACLFNGWY